MPSDLTPLDLGGGFESGISIEIPPLPFEGHITPDRSFAQVLTGVQAQLHAASSAAKRASTSSEAPATPNLKRPRFDSDASESSSYKRPENR